MLKQVMTTEGLEVFTLRMDRCDKRIKKAVRNGGKITFSKDKEKFLINAIKDKKLWRATIANALIRYSAQTYTHSHTEKESGCLH